MILKVGNQSFDSADVPVAVVLSSKELEWVINTKPKPEGQFHALAKAPKDIPPAVLISWMAEACPEVKVTKERLSLTHVKGD